MKLSDDSYDGSVMPNLEVYAVPWFPKPVVISSIRCELVGLSS